jgi:hypothetical protein
MTRHATFVAVFTVCIPGAVHAQATPARESGTYVTLEAGEIQPPPPPKFRGKDAKHKVSIEGELRLFWKYEYKRLIVQVRERPSLLNQKPELMVDNLEIEAEVEMPPSPNPDRIPTTGKYKKTLSFTADHSKTYEVKVWMMIVQDGKENPAATFPEGGQWQTLRFVGEKKADDSDSRYRELRATPPAKDGKPDKDK